MKLRLLFFLGSILCALCVKSVSASDAPPAVVIADTGNCYLDGVNAGQPADVIANHPARAPEVSAALVAFVKKTTADSAAAIKTAQDAAAKSIADSAKAKDAEIAATIAAKDKEIADLKARIAALEKQWAAMNTPAADATP